MRVAVYGTLKKGQGNHHLLDQPGAQFLGKGLTGRPYQMYCVGFPIVIDGPNGFPVAVELYEVDRLTFARLDRLESNGRMYQRARRWCWVDGERVRAWIYLGMDFPGRSLRKVQLTMRKDHPLWVYSWPDPKALQLG